MSSAVDQVSGDYANHLLLFGSRNVSAIASQYEGNATVQFKGIDIGLIGNYTGTSSIRQLLSALLGPLSYNSSGQVNENPKGYFFIANESQPTTQVLTTGSRSSVTAGVINSTFDFRGWGPTVGNFNGTVSAQTYYVHGSGNASWLISKEAWNILRFWAQIQMTT